MRLAAALVDLGSILLEILMTDQSQLPSAILNLCAILVMKGRSRNVDCYFLLFLDDAR